MAVACIVGGGLQSGLAADSLRISDGSRFVSKDLYPRFTWDRIPLYMHIRKAKSYTDKEIAFLARFPLITFEKANGHQDHGSVEAGTLKAARSVKKINPNTTILYYRNVMVHYGGYAADKGLGQIPGALLRDKNGNTKLVRNRVEAYDLSNADLRTWWVDTCSSMTADPHIDGIFFDGNVKALEPGYLARQIGTVKKKQTMDGYHLMMKQTRQAIGPNKLMIANLLRARFENAGLEYLDYFDGSYLEGFFHNVGGAGYQEYVAKGIDAMQKAARQGKIIAFTTAFASPKNTSVMGIDEGHATVGSHAQARAGLAYPLAIFLVCAEKHSYFRIHEGYSANENDRWMRWFPEYDRPLGPPNGPATKDGFRYSRKFRHATVQLDIRKRAASIQWHETATGHPPGARTSEDGVTKMEPTWESMAENYRVPDWFVDGKIGIWTHWGVPSAVDENRPNDGSHYGRRMYGPNEGETGAQLKMTQTLADWHVQRYGNPSEFGYEDLIPLFKAEKWDPEALVRFFKSNGARFIMPVACHHDNFDMYDSSHPWNAMDMGPKRDTLREWKHAAHKHGLKFGVSTHLYWSPRFFNTARKHQTPGTLEAKLFNMEYDPRNYSRQDSWNRHWYDRCWEIIEKYDPDMFNNDSPYPRIGTGKGLGIKLFTDYLNRDLKENDGKQTVVLSFKDGKADRRAFTYNLERGSAADIKPKPWMWATDLSGGWFYRKGAVNRMSIPVMVGNAVDAISKNGVVMLNIALRGDGTLPDNQAAYLTAFGDFLRINGEGIYGTRPWKTFGEGPLKMKDGRQGENHKNFSQADIRFTTKDGVLYAFVLATPTEDIVIKKLASDGLLDCEIAGIELMGSSEEIKWNRSSDALTILLPKSLPSKIVNGFRILSK